MHCRATTCSCWPDALSSLVGAGKKTLSPAVDVPPCLSLYLHTTTSTHPLSFYTRSCRIGSFGSGLAPIMPCAAPTSISSISPRHIISYSFFFPFCLCRFSLSFQVFLIQLLTSTSISLSLLGFFSHFLFHLSFPIVSYFAQGIIDSSLFNPISHVLLL